MSDDQLNHLRSQIDRIDDQLLELISERNSYAIEIGKIKTQNRGDTEVSFFRPEREINLLSRLIERNKGPLTAEQIEKIFREIISTSLALEQPLSIAFLGPEGTYSHSASLKQFGSSALLRSESSIFDVFQSVENETAHFGVVPVENSTEGAVNQTLDALIDTDLYICSEVNLPIHHAFLILPGAQTDEIDVIYSHEQSLAQCRDWLRQHYPSTPTKSVSSNGEAAQLVSQDSRAAAIAGELAAQEFNLEIVHRRIEDKRFNATRFFVLGRQRSIPSGMDKTSILVYTANRAGALLEVLMPFDEYGINLSRVVSRPAPAGQWSYVFFIDFDGHVEDQGIKTVLSEIREVAFDVKILGSYPRTLEA